MGWGGNNWRENQEFNAKWELRFWTSPECADARRELLRKQKEEEEQRARDSAQYRREREAVLRASGEMRPNENLEQYKARREKEKATDDLREALSTGDVNAMCSCIERGADPRTTDSKGRSALTFAKDELSKPIPDKAKRTREIFTGAPTGCGTDYDHCGNSHTYTEEYVVDKKAVREARARRYEQIRDKVYGISSNYTGPQMDSSPTQSSSKSGSSGDKGDMTRLAEAKQGAPSAKDVVANAPKAPAQVAQPVKKKPFIKRLFHL